MAGTTERNEEVGLETFKSGPEWHTLARDLTTVIETGERMANSVEALDLGAGCFVRFPTLFIPANPSPLDRPQSNKGEKTWIPDVHLEKTEDGWTLAPGASYGGK